MEMESFVIPLYYFCSIAGLIMVVGGIWLIYKQKIYLDKESKEVMEIETPIGLKFKTNIPALVLFVLGFIPLIYPIISTKGMQKEIKIVGYVKSTIHPVQIYVVLEAESLIQDRDFNLWVPSSSKTYKIIYVAKDIVLEDIADPQNMKGEEIKLPAKEILANNKQSFEPNVSSVPQEFK
jgi:hypothetical protein